MSRDNLVRNLREIADVLETAGDLVISRENISLEQEVRTEFLGDDRYFQPRAIPTSLTIDIEAAWTDYTIKEVVERG